MKKKILLINVFFFIIFTIAMFCVKYNFQKFSKELLQIQKEINVQNKNNKILEAEYAFLINPSRIESLAQKYLNYKKQGIDNFNYLMHKEIYDINLDDITEKINQNNN